MFLYDMERKMITSQTGYKAYIIESCWAFSIDVKHHTDFSYKLYFLPRITIANNSYWPIWGRGPRIIYEFSIVCHVTSDSRTTKPLIPNLSPPTG